jgi:hypothetical protein
MAKQRGPDRWMIPGGECPVPLTGSDAATVEKWMDDVTAAKPCGGVALGSTTFIYYAGYYYDKWKQTDEYNAIVGHIKMSWGGWQDPPRPPGDNRLGPAPLPHPSDPPPPPVKKPIGPPPPPPRRVLKDDADVLRRPSPPPPSKKRKRPPPLPQK